MFSLSGWRKKLLIVALISAGAFGLARLYYRLTDDIRLANMIYEMPHHKEWEISPPPVGEQAQIDAILSQPFHYIGKGAQAYAFASADDQYVLKLFKFKHLKPSWFVDLLPPFGPLKKYKDSQVERKRRKLEGVFEGYRLAYDVHKKPSGILFIHLNPTDNLHKTVLIRDKIGLAHHIDVDKFVFILQEKAQTTRTVINKLLNEGNVEEAKARIGQIFTLYLSEYEKGIWDHDHGVMHNTGFVGARPIHLDVGKLSEAPEMKEAKFSHPDLERIAYKFHTWARIHQPQYSRSLDAYMEDQLSKIFGSTWTFQQPSR